MAAVFLQFKFNSAVYSCTFTFFVNCKLLADLSLSALSRVNYLVVDAFIFYEGFYDDDLLLGNCSFLLKDVLLPFDTTFSFCAG